MSLNVLVVDDSRVMRAMVVRSLRLSGLPLGEVCEAGDGAEALRLLGGNWIDLALVDLNMPVLDGEALIRALREDPATADLAVVVVSTEGSESRIERLRALGAAFVHKPFTPEALREVVLRITGITDEQICGGLAPAGGELDF